MKGTKYKLLVAPSVYEYMHHHAQMEIIEIYLPEIKVAFNDEGFIFRAEEERYSNQANQAQKLEEVVVSAKDAKVFLEKVESEEKAKEAIGRYLALSK